ncbi:hypothetical protein [Streptomyces sp. NPDC006463]|uniref:hypothetical protein n=1 Tax=Streptomyces sp. NPDC006463 TaxID=3364746 RepID=UPI0036AEE480
MLIFLAVGFFLSVVPAGVLGCVFVLVSRRLSLVARIPLLVALAVGSGVAWHAILPADNWWRPIVMLLSFTATLVTGTVSLFVGEALRRRRRVPQFPPPVWPARRP